MLQLLTAETIWGRCVRQLVSEDGCEQVLVGLGWGLALTALRILDGTDLEWYV